MEDQKSQVRNVGLFDHFRINDADILVNMKNSVFILF